MLNLIAILENMNSKKNEYLLFKDLVSLTLMNSYSFLISNYVKNNTKDNKDIEILKSNLYKIGILLKDYPEENLILLYNKYENKSKNRSVIELECRSVILDRTTFNIVCYTCPTPIYNINAVNYLLGHNDDKKDIFKCYEGSLLSVYHYNEKWYLSSRKCLDSKDSVINDNSHYDMFLDVIRQDNFNTFDEFASKLDVNYTYHFVLIHHKNENIVNYKLEFGNEYKKLCFIFARNSTNHQEINSEDIDSLFLSDNIFLPKRLEDESSFDKINQFMDVNEKPITEGIVIKVNNNLLKLQSLSYQFYKVIGPEKNLYRGFLSLYQTNNLKKYFSNNTYTQKYQKIVNPTNTSESFDTIGIIDAVFKVCTSELLNLFKIFWDDKENHKCSSLYELLPKEYKDILFHLRGIYFHNKKVYENSKSTDYLRIQNVYNYIKNMDTRSFENFLRCRKLMLNWLRVDKQNPNLQIFSQSLTYKNNSKEQKVYYKLISIYCNKLFPEIMPDELPQKLL